MGRRGTREIATLVWRPAETMRPIPVAPGDGRPLVGRGIRLCSVLLLACGVPDGGGDAAE